MGLIKECIFVHCQYCDVVWVPVQATSQVPETIVDVLRAEALGQNDICGCRRNLTTRRRDRTHALPSRKTRFDPQTCELISVNILCQFITRPMLANIGPVSKRHGRGFLVSPGKALVPRSTVVFVLIRRPLIGKRWLHTNYFCHNFVDFKNMCIPLAYA